MVEPPRASLGNWVWEDVDRDGIQDAGEVGVPGVTLQLWNAAMTQLISSTVSNSNGNYTLVTPAPGDYRLRVLEPLGFTISPKNQGSDNSVDNNFNPSAPVGFTDIYTVTANLISDTRIDAGLVGRRMFRNGFESP